MLNSIGELPVSAAKKYGDRIALISGKHQFTFSDIDNLSNRCANALVGLGVESGDRVTLYATNSWQWVVSYYGALKAGAVINPINSMLTAHETGFVIKDCEPKVVLASAENAMAIHDIAKSQGTGALISFGETKLPGVILFQDLLNQSEDNFTAVEREPDALSTIAYTSGTTGQPKGACLSHKNVLLNVFSTSMMHGRNETDTVVSALPCTHVYGNVVMNSAIQSGMKLVLHSLFDEAAVLQSLQDYRATLFEGVPTMYMYLLNYPHLSSFDLSALRCCTVGGQTMPVSKMEEVESRFGCPLIELWGMTELAGLGTTFAFKGPIKHGSIGVALPYVEAKIVDLDNPDLTQPPGKVGELMIKGDIVMQGYYGNEEATSTAIASDGWLQTGDVAMKDESGNIFVVDRKKDMIITAGYNIYPAELERVIASHPDVAMVAVGSVPDPIKGELPKAYVMARSGADHNTQSILDHCRQHLAPYKVPRLVQFVGDFPKTSSGKIMRHRLAELDAA